MLDVIDEKILTKLRRALVEVVDSFIMLICYPLPECVLCTTSFDVQNLNAKIIKIRSKKRFENLKLQNRKFSIAARFVP